MSTIDHDKIVKSVPQKGFFGHPKGLYTLFFTEFWERFSYYGMRALLIYYMYTEVTKGGLGFDQTTANSIMSVYGALVYMSGVIGGWLADRVFGSSSTVFYGGVFIMFGHVILALPSGATALFISMGLIIIGTGLLKPNVSNIVGDLYTKTDPRRDSGFSIFYMGINMGGFISPLIVGTLGQKVNFHLGFSLAAVGMLVGLITFVITKKPNLGLAGTYVTNPLSAAERKNFKIYGSLVVILLAVFAVIGIQTGALTINLFTWFVSALGVLIPIVYFIIMYFSKKTSAVEQSRVLAYIPLFLAAVMFWAIQEQGSNILATYADQRTNLNFLGMTLASSWFQSLNPIFIVLLSPVFAWLWVRLGKKQPSTPIKFSLGLLFAGLSFIIMIIPAYMSGPNTLVSPLWLVLSFFLVVIGELCLSPVGLSATTKLAPAAFSAQTMSLWFLSNAMAQAINAQVVKLFDKVPETVYFGIIGFLAIVLCGVMLLLTPVIKKAMKGVH
ncbi:peptide MFS transporter [Bacillus safensis]|uniref:peptide MFS transporter n=1 Tax=Bacillus safensis TaxID=561879 RepID=UPI00227DB2D3|nr:peptide MFS transporter [Bacillus safensis]MCY7673534.1 peptide MFS transporter [Bacillus safensis]MCY7698542.1 peptide MFS transporter [Bacillus safensis]MEC3629278.1 peptide MFS transporter [Bacillus safensis]